MKKVSAWMLGVSILLSACQWMTFVLPGPTPSASLPPPTETPAVMSSPTWTLTATIGPTFTPTFTASPIPTLTASPVPTATWVHQGPDNVTVPILLFHHIGISPTNSRYYTSPEKFEAELKLLHDWEYTTITTELLIKAIKEGADLPPRPIIITFDDGNLNNYTTAFPIMQKYGFTGVLYIVGKYMGASNFMNADQIREMAAAGWEVGSHSMSHKDLTLLDSTQQRYQIVESREKLEDELGVSVLTFAYPFGLSNGAVVDYVKFAGYGAGMSLGHSHEHSEWKLYSLQRRDIKGTYDLKQFASYLPWQGDPIYLPTETPTPTSTP